jgi:hypothetical protein
VTKSKPNIGEKPKLAKQQANLVKEAAKQVKGKTSAVEGTLKKMVKEGGTLNKAT